MTETGLSVRLANYRKRAGYRSAAALAEAIGGGSVTTSVIQNVESGRKKDLSVSQLLDIAMALRVPPAALIVDIGNLGDPVDVNDPSPAVARMTNAEVLGWFGDDYSPDTEFGGWMWLLFRDIRDIQAAKAQWDELETRSLNGDRLAYPQLIQLSRRAALAYRSAKAIARDLDWSWAEGPWLFQAEVNDADPAGWRGDDGEHQAEA